MGHDPHLHLFIDDHEIDYRRALTRLVEVPQRVQREPVLEPGPPWEDGAVSLWGSVYGPEATGDSFRMWYLGSSERGSFSGRFTSSICYATSADGRTWTRGDFDHVSHPTAERNNLVFRDEREPPVRRTHPFTVLIDPVEPDAGRRCKFIGFYADDARTRGYVIAYSGDGIHWQPDPQRVVQPRGDHTAVMQDFARGGFIMTSRGDHGLRDREAGHAVTRDICVSRSPDLLDWSPGAQVFAGDDDDPPGTEFYGMPIFNWGNQYVGLLAYYDPTNELLNVQLATSRDGDHWQRACSRRTYFDVGSSDAWDSTWVAFGMSPPVVVGEQMLFWFTGRPAAHRRGEGIPFRSAVGLARAPRDRFAGLRAGPDGGELTTSPVQVGGPQLLLNIGAAAGPVTVAVTGDDGQAIDGYGHDDCDRRIANGVDVAVSWGGRDLAPLVGRSVRLHLRVTYATVFAYRFAAAPPQPSQTSQSSHSA